MSEPTNPRHPGWARGALAGSLAWAALAAGLPGVAATARAQEVAVVVSSRAGDRLQPKPSLRFEPSVTGRKADFALDTSLGHQAIAGFGASFLEAGLICLNSLTPDRQEAVLQALFDPHTGAGFSVMKTPIGATDFMSAGPWYSYDDAPGDVELQHFSIARDLGPNGVLTFIKRARRHGSFLLEAPMDYPPDWMLADLEHRDRQDVDPRYFPALARYYLRYLQEYERNGVTIDYLSLFNEPGIYTKIPYASIRDLLAKHVGPLFESAGVRTRLCFAESEDRETAGASFPTVLDDPAARKYAAVLMYHAYRLRSSRPIEDLRRRYPDLPVWQSEVCHAYNAGTPRSMRLPRLDFDDGDFWGNLIVSDLEAGASAWLYWNMILDEKGGPWLVSEVHEDPDPNVQQAIVHVDRATRQVTYTGLYYYLAHFSRFVRPGAVRVEVRGALAGARCVAFRTPEGGVVVQLVNSRKGTAHVRLAWQGRTLQAALPARSITTLRWPAAAGGRRP